LKKLEELGLLHRDNPETELQVETSFESYVTVEWEIPSDQALGNYRIIYLGDYMNNAKEVKPFNGTSTAFRIV